MSDSFPKVEYQRLRVGDVRAVDVTEIVTDETGDTPVYRRSLRISGLPLTDTTPSEVLEIILEADQDPEDIEIETPKLGF